MDVGKQLLNKVWDGMKGVWESISSWFSGIWDTVTGWIGGLFGKKNEASKAANGSHRTGLSEVPYDGYIAELHRGEMILTAAEADRYQKEEKQQTGGGNITVNNYSPKALSAKETARLFRRSQKQLALGFC